MRMVTCGNLWKSYLVTNVIVEPSKGKLNIALNEEELPNLKINSQYKKLLKDPDTSEEIRHFIKERIRDGVWLIKAIEQRQKNILKVVREIFKIQRRAAVTELSNIKPLTLKEIASKSGLHLSTVARIVANKYVSTPHGTVQLKEFFGTKYISKEGKLYSDKNISAKIKTIIYRENKGKPLPDQAISAVLGDEGIKVSRRTVAKYRDKLKIPPSFLR